MTRRSIELIGYTCGIGAGVTDCYKGPGKVKSSAHLKKLQSYLHWNESYLPGDIHTHQNKLQIIASLNETLAQTTAMLVAKEQFFITIGGDHTCAIGTWSGVAAAITPLTLGLIWIDAHLDSHTPATTPSGNIHGMPLAALLGHGEAKLTEILTKQPKLLPQNVCVVGARSFEEGELKLLERLKVRIFFMEEIIERGLAPVLQEAHAIVTENAQYYGISFDLDAIDPEDVPGVGTPEKNGIKAQAFLDECHYILSDQRLIGAEIVEFNPERDINERTEIFVAETLEAFTK